MLIEITYACKMGCSHCMSDCKPDGENMSIDTFNNALDFMINNRIKAWIFSGGEMFEHPDIIQILEIIESKWKEVNYCYPITFITNGRELVRNQEIYNKVADLQKRYRKSLIMIQVTDDSRYYPDPLTDKEKYWLKKLGAIIDAVPSDPKDKSRCLYPQGRALVNHTDDNWNTIGPKCANCVLVAKQTNCSFSDLVNHLLLRGKLCTPVIAPDGSIKVGESALCPSVASIYDDDSTIIEKIRNHKCHQCSIAWDRLKETNLLAYNMLNK